MLVFGALVTACRAPAAAPLADAALPADAASDGALPADAAGGGACTRDADCPGAHEVCDDSVAPHACVCAAGYAADPQGACAWVGVVANPGFIDQSGWALQGDTRINDTYAVGTGQSEVGAASFWPRGPDDPLYMCDGLPYMKVAQTITMPRRSRAEPLVVEAHYYDDTPTMIGVDIGVDTVWHHIPVTIPDPQQWTWSVTRSCLGADEYAPESTTGRGAPRSLAIMANQPTVCLHDSQLWVDRVDIVPALPGECPDVGQVVNGDAEGSGGWSFGGWGTGTGGLVDGVGAGGSRAVELHTSQTCDLASASVPLSIPLAAASPALTFYRKTAVGTQDELLLDAPGGLRIDGTGDGQAHTVKVCIPGYLRGSVRTLSFDVMSMSGACTATSHDDIIDDVAIVDDPGCGTDPWIADGGFEATDTLPMPYPAAQEIQDAGLAHTGTGVLRLADTSCGAIWNTRFATPRPVAGAGPALAFYYRMDPGPNEALTFFPDWVKATLTADGAWHRGVACLDPGLADNDDVMQFKLAYTGSSCPGPHAAVYAYLDDVTATTDPSCPTM